MIGHLIVGSIYTAELAFAYLGGLALYNLTDLIRDAWARR